MSKKKKKINQDSWSSGFVDSFINWYFVYEYLVKRKKKKINLFDVKCYIIFLCFKLEYLFFIEMYKTQIYTMT
jgi:hypothetical protein